MTKTINVTYTDTVENLTFWAQTHGWATESGITLEYFLQNAVNQCLLDFISVPIKQWIINQKAVESEQMQIGAVAQLAERINIRVE